MLKNVYIFGIGMMGGSIAKALKKSKLAKKIYATDINPRVLEYAKTKKIINDFDYRNYEFLSEADLIIISSPMLAYEGIFNIIDNYRKEKCIVTDIGSTKKDCMKIIKKYSSLSKRFVGSHPLTGKEKSTIKNSDADIFNDQYVLLCPSLNSSKNAEVVVKNFWRLLGCKSLVISASHHDRILSKTSHLPHIVSYLLVNMILKDRIIDNLEFYTGGGFRDLARLAQSDSKMWSDIISTNKINLMASIDKFILELTKFKKNINNRKANDIEKYIKSLKYHPKKRKNA
tara:strand:+ start:153 stop:1010 length:858 start_codon:yes stop_codon:yes gene_type:complete